MFKKKKEWYALPDEIICLIMSFIVDSRMCNAHNNKNYEISIKILNKLYLINKQFNECSINIFDNTFYKDLLFKNYFINSKLEFELKEFNNYKIIYSHLNHYNKLKNKQLKGFKPNHLPHTLFNNQCFKMNIAIVGNKSVGKTNLIFNFLKDKFVQHHNNGNTIIDSYSKMKSLYETTYLLELFDVNYSEQDFRGYRDVQTANCIMAICDLTRKETLNEVKITIKTFYKMDIPIMVIGNKLDLIEKENKNREITKEMIENLVKDDVCDDTNGLKFIYFETSAETGYNVEEVFSEAMRIVLHINVDWGNVITKLLKGKNIFTEFGDCNNDNCFVM
ncbi:hypothetical protein ABK040_006886 [Willaertia magna]